MSALEEMFAACRVAGGTDLEGRHWLGVVARRTYRWVDDGRASSTNGSEVPSSREHELMGIFEADDLAVLKPCTDVLLTGAVSGDGATTVRETSLRVGPLQKKVRVSGRRFVARTSRGVELTQPEPIDTVPLDWARAFGGEDPGASKSLRGRSGRTDDELDLPIYPRNPFGTGYRIAGGIEAVVGLEVPSLDDPDDPISADRLVPIPHELWPERPVPAGYGPINRFVFPRFQNAIARGVGAFDLREVRSGELDAHVARAEMGTSTLNERFLQCASPGLGRSLLRGDEKMVLDGFERGGRPRSCALPGEVPDMSIHLPGVGTRRLEPRLKTLLIEISSGRVSTTWAGRIEVAVPYGHEELDMLNADVRWSRTLGPSERESR